MIRRCGVSGRQAYPKECLGESKRGNTLILYDCDFGGRTVLAPRRPAGAQPKEDSL
jgi:hypothetical protein